MRRTLLLTAVLATVFFSAEAQFSSLSKDEIVKLKRLINTNASAKETFGNFKAAAAKAMTEQPNPIEEITSEGLLAGNPDKVKSLKAVEDADKIYALALVYKVAGNKACLDKASQYLLAWAKVNKSNGDPIDETKLEAMFSGYDLIRDDVSADVRKTTDEWLNSIADGEINSKYAQGDKGTAINNWNSHRIKIITMISYATHNKSNYSMVQRELEKQIAINLFPDGSGHDFKERDALHYHIYTLEPLLSAISTIYRATGKDYFNYQSATGSSVKKSVDFLVPFVNGEKTHGEFLNSKSGFDRARAKNGEAGYLAGAKFKPETGVYCLEQASYFSGTYLVAVLAVSATQYNNDWQILLNKVREPFKTK
ncbi:alginate lyase family protein [Mucilaginibacter sp. HMF5004]|uniref:alginate lyase family protein n=1 Tax=Mucilaginibacter rivuli TaxID=2857527 RepID=UPI001C5F82F0|nr:alginate lyase family protein [Mucilaginibacter rivuli]MBW4888564.1 alginate lyase family protein [Mucilaginibacter rivuli]